MLTVEGIVLGFLMTIIVSKIRILYAQTHVRPHLDIIVMATQKPYAQMVSTVQQVAQALVLLHAHLVTYALPLDSQLLLYVHWVMCALPLGSQLLLHVHKVTHALPLGSLLLFHVQ